MDLREHLKTQLRLLKRSSAIYDQGHTDEALHIAVTLRVLFHDTRNSTSLCSHLGVKSRMRLVSTIGSGKKKEDVDPSRMGIAPLMLSFDGVKPLLGKAPRRIELGFEDWWHEVIMAQNVVLTRRDIVLSAANQDGGAHIDCDPSQKTRELKKGVGTLILRSGGKETVETLTNHHYPQIRQFAFEVVTSHVEKHLP